MAGEGSLSNRRITRSMTASSKRSEESPSVKKKIRLPQEDVDRILSRPQVLELPPYIKDLKHWNPSLIPSAEEAMDEETMKLYDEARLFSDSTEAYKEFQAWVRSDYAKYGYVEVEDDFLAKVEEARVSQAEFKAELAQDMDDELKRIIFRGDPL